MNKLAVSFMIGLFAILISLLGCLGGGGGGGGNGGQFGTVRGTVVNERGTPVPAVVTASTTPPTQLQTSDGNFVMNLPAGQTFLLTATTSDGKSGFIFVNVRSGENPPVTIQVSSSGGGDGPPPPPGF